MLDRMLDSRSCLGTDLHRCSPTRYPYEESSIYNMECFPARNIRVILGKLGKSYRFSAPDIDIVAEGQTIETAWKSFLDLVIKLDDVAWMTFDVGPTRPHEIDLGLNAHEDEYWYESID